MNNTGLNENNCFSNLIHHIRPNIENDINIINPLTAVLVYIRSTVYFPWCLARKYTTHNDSSYDLTFL